jgi:predicted tellurium resistance membrane protein TerC
LVIGIGVAIVGGLIQSDIVAGLINVVGWIIIIGGVIVAVTGLVKMFSGNNGG